VLSWGIEVEAFPFGFYAFLLFFTYGLCPQNLHSEDVFWPEVPEDKDRQAPFLPF
jgi:hypothetical protein